MKRIRMAVRQWWNGEYVPYRREPGNDLIIIGGDEKRHWTADAARGVVAFAQKEWKWLIGFFLALAGLYLALPA